jgi:hypothetical protein
VHQNAIAQRRRTQITQTILRLDVEEDYPDLVLDGDVLIQQDGHNVPHVIADAFSFGISAHGKILFDFAQLVNIALWDDGMFYTKSDLKQVLFDLFVCLFVCLFHGVRTST